MIEQRRDNLIRLMTEQDLASVQEVILAAQKGVMYDIEPFLRKCLMVKGELSLVAEVDGQVAGVVLGSLLGVLGMVDVMAVKPAFQRQGMGSVLIEALIERVWARGARKLVVLSWDHSTSFYENLGFRTDPSIHFMSRDIGTSAETRAVEVQT
jgi:predicted N-acetyltransferase YhbS